MKNGGAYEQVCGSIIYVTSLAAIVFARTASEWLLGVAGVFTATALALRNDRSEQQRSMTFWGGVLSALVLGIGLKFVLFAVVLR